MRTNLHVHTNFSDGAETPETMLKAAINHGFSAIGFTDHAYSPHAPDFGGVTREKYADYAAEINRLKCEYASRIDVFLGLEIDSLGPLDVPNLDYAIGSVHDIFLRDGKTVCCVDYDNSLSGKVEFNGEEWELVENYYKTVIQMIQNLNFDIVGHFDIVKRFNQNNRLFNPNAQWYKTLALQAIEVASSKIVEVNLGGMARGFIDEPYPSVEILYEFKKRNTPLVITTDAHTLETLDCGYDDTEKLLQEIGYKTQKKLGIFEVYLP